MNTLITLAYLTFSVGQCPSENQRLIEPTDEVIWATEQGKLFNSLIYPLIPLTNIFI